MPDQSEMTEQDDTDLEVEETNIFNTSGTKRKFPARQESQDPHWDKKTQDKCSHQRLRVAENLGRQVSCWRIATSWVWPQADYINKYNFM